MVKNVEASFVLQCEVDAVKVDKQIENLEIVLADRIMKSCVTIRILEKKGMQLLLFKLFVGLIKQFRKLIKKYQKNVSILHFRLFS